MASFCVKKICTLFVFLVTQQSITIFQSIIVYGTTNNGYFTWVKSNFAWVTKVNEWLNWNTSLLDISSIASSVAMKYRRAILVTPFVIAKLVFGTMLNNIYNYDNHHWHFLAASSLLCVIHPKVEIQWRCFELPVVLYILPLYQSHCNQTLHF